MTQQAKPLCDVCGAAATVIRPATANRELAYYCDYDAKRSLGWGDSFHRLVAPHV
jgi:hypothetical protein